VKPRSLTGAVLSALGVTKENVAALRTAAVLAQVYAKRHGWRATVAAFIAPEGP
jgi:hypothetical protein